MLHSNKFALIFFFSFPCFAFGYKMLCDAMLMQIVEREAESGGKLGDLDSYEIEGGETKSEVLQNLTEYQFSCVSFL